MSYWTSYYDHDDDHDDDDERNNNTTMTVDDDNFGFRFQEWDIYRDAREFRKEIK